MFLSSHYASYTATRYQNIASSEFAVASVAKKAKPVESKFTLFKDVLGPRGKHCCVRLHPDCWGFSCFGFNNFHSRVKSAVEVTQVEAFVRAAEMDSKTLPVTITDAQTNTLTLPNGCTCTATSTRTGTNTTDGKTVSPGGYTHTTTQPVVSTPKPPQ
jgi:hypothetical protein